ncbi:MAG: DNA repair protein RecO [Candidatus Margulisbacteria bacterium GWF2_35_9]|nr:MAG: DNA repair protein RecO [Candidatus Margulisbacteria bacterium GWF2_35_9]
MFLKTEGINLKTINYSESSQIVIIFSKEHGKMSLLAKGVKKSSRSYKGKLQTFMHNHYLVSKKTTMGIISQIDSIHPFLDLSKNYEKISAAYQCLDIVYKIIQDNHQYTELFDCLLQTLKEIETNSNISHFDKITCFKKQILHMEGIFADHTKDHQIDNLLNQYIGQSKVIL